MTDIASFRQSVEAFIAARGWTPTRFGRSIAGDPLFVFDLREGREPRSETRARILKAMQEQAESAAQPPLRIGVAGLGNVGATLVAILQKDGTELTRKLGRQVVVTAVCARSRSKDRDVVHTMIHQVRADGIVTIHLERDLQFRSYAIDARD